MAPGDVCHGPRCSLAGLGPAALGYRPCCWRGGSAGSPQCARPMECWFFPVPRPPYARTCVRCPGPLGSCSPVCPRGLSCCVCGVLGHLAPVHRCARVICCVACAVSWATWLLFTGVRAPCVVLLVRCLGPLGSFSPVRSLGVLFCLCGVLGHLAPVHRCACSVCCFACAVSWALWLLFTSLPAWCVLLCVLCRGPLGSCSPVCALGVLLCVCGVLGSFAPVHRCVRPVRYFACAVSWATWLLFTGVPAQCVACVCRVLGRWGDGYPGDRRQRRSDCRERGSRRLGPLPVGARRGGSQPHDGGCPDASELQLGQGLVVVVAPQPSMQGRVYLHLDSQEGY